jgi:vitamin K-dependent gamma-carboxylase
MVLDIHIERGFSEVDHRFGDFTQCHFPLFDFVKPLTFQWMCMLYLLMWLGKFIVIIYTSSAVSLFGFSKLISF